MVTISVLMGLAGLALGMEPGPMGNRAGVAGVENRAAAAVETGGWILLDGFTPDLEAAEPWIRPTRGQALMLDRAVMERALAAAPHEDAGRPGVLLILPTPDGRLARFLAVESPVMEPALQAQFPEIRTYRAVGIDDPFAVARVSLTPGGFAAVVRTPDDSWSGGLYAIDAYVRGSDVWYTSYFRRDAVRKGQPFRCLTPPAAGARAPLARKGAGWPHAELDGGPGGSGYAPRLTGPIRRTLRLAVNATGEYTAFHGGTVAGGLAAIVNVVNRLNSIYEADLAVRLVLIANQSLLISTNAATDPFTSPGLNQLTLDQSQARLDAVIGSANYDVGHVFHRGDNAGVAGAIGNVCIAGGKGRGLSQTDPPTGDLFTVDYVAHELGHQFGGRHTFQDCGDGPGDAVAVAVEPGSGSTIMSYAGICAEDNIVFPGPAGNATDPDFHALNIRQINDFLNTVTCDVGSPTGNNAPVIDAGPAFTIPRGTPFALTATVSDPDGNPVTVDWEQMNTGANPMPLTGFETTGSTFRSFLATASPTRTFQRLADLTNNVFQPGERLPVVARTMIFRATARDGLGGVNHDNTTVTVAAAGPFRVTSPNTGVRNAGLRTVTWDVAGTDLPPIATANVRILLSTDGGLTYPTVLAASTPNDGSEVVRLPDVSSPTARIRVEAVGNIYFDISDVNFTLAPSATGAAFEAGGRVTISDAIPNGNANSRAEPGESNLLLTIPVLNNGRGNAAPVAATLTSLTPTATVVAPASRALPGAAPFSIVSAVDPFRIALAPTHPCGQPVALRLSVASPQGAGVFNVTIPTGTTPEPGPQQIFSYTGPAVPIPDNNPAGAVATLNVSGVSGLLSDVDLRIDGTACTSAAGSTTVGLAHTFVGDLIIRLRHPSGAAVTLFNRNPSNNNGNNFCNTRFDDAAANSIASITAAGNPWSGSFRPIEALSAFNGLNPNGVWRLEVVDAVATDVGTLRAFSLIVRGQTTPVCDPPLPDAPCPCPADFDGSGGTPDGNDIDTFFASWINGDAAADTDCSGGTPDGADVEVFFNAWIAGGC